MDKLTVGQLVAYLRPRLKISLPYSEGNFVYPKESFLNDMAEEIIKMAYSYKHSNYDPASPVGMEALPVTGPTDGSTRQADVTAGKSTKQSVPCEHNKTVNNICQSCGAELRWGGHGTEVQIIPLEDRFPKFMDVPTKTSDDR